MIAVVNVVMLLAGCSLVQLVMVTTTVRIATYFVYRLNAYQVFPALRIQPSRFLWARVRELTSFSVYVSIIDWSNKLNYSIDAIVIGAYISSAAVALWTVPQRLAEMLQRLTNQLNGVLFPVVVDSDAGNKPERLRAIFIQGTRLSLVSVVPLAAALFLLADPLIRAWVGPKFLESILVTQILILRRRDPRRQRDRHHGAQGRRAAPAAGVHQCRHRARQHRAQPAVDPPLRPDRPGDGHADPGRLLLDVHPLARRLPAGRHGRVCRVRRGGVADAVADRGDGARHYPAAQRAAGAAVGGGAGRRVSARSPTSPRSWHSL